MTLAVLDVYAKQLKDNPQDYTVWLNRANEYYRHDEYMKALYDVEHALEYIPSKQTADRQRALMLRANIYIQTNRPEEALADLNDVITLDCEDFVALYQRANTLYALGRYSEAKLDYQRMLRLDSRNPEAVVGLARIAVKENNLGQAEELLEQAVSLNPNNADLYVRRASVRYETGNYKEAVADLILALATDSSNKRATAMLIECGDANYNATVSALTDAVMQAPGVDLYPYLRAVIEERNHRYKAALTDYEALIDHSPQSNRSLWRSMAACRFALGQFEKALSAADIALAYDPNDGEAALLRARILRAMGKSEEARQQANTALYLMPDKSKALWVIGLTYVDSHDYTQSADLFAEAVAKVEDSSPTQWGFLLEAWVKGSLLNLTDDATDLYDKVANIAAHNTDSKLARIYGAFGLLFGARRAKAIAAINTILSENASNPYINYIGACFYAQIDDFDKAFEYAKVALETGYANYYDWAYNNDALLNVAPLRTDLRFINLMERFKHLWSD